MNPYLTLLEKGFHMPHSIQALKGLLNLARTIGTVHASNSETQKWSIRMHRACHFTLFREGPSKAMPQALSEI